MLSATSEEAVKCKAKEDGRNEPEPFMFREEKLEAKHNEIARGVETTEGGESKSSLYKWITSYEWIKSSKPSKWRRISLSLLSLAAGIIFTSVAYIYPMRMVRSVTYLRSNQTLQLVTYTPLGKTRTLQVPLVDVSSKITEQVKGQNVALKVNGHAMLFQLNTDKADVNPLFRTIVLNRYGTEKPS